MEERGTDWSGNVQDVFIGDLSSSQQLVLQLDVPRDVTEVRLSLGDKTDCQETCKGRKGPNRSDAVYGYVKSRRSVGEISDKHLMHLEK